MRKKTAALGAFGPGDHVEVFSDAEGFVGSYFEGIVVESLGSNLYRVEYTNLTETEEEGSALLKETVAGELMRPYPPKIRLQRGFRTMEAVDVLYNEGWWVGRVTGMKPDGMYYYVYFDSTKDELLYPVSSIRLHLDWVHAHWVLPPSDANNKMKMKKKKKKQDDKKRPRVEEEEEEEKRRMKRKKQDDKKRPRVEEEEEKKMMKPTRIRVLFPSLENVSVTCLQLS